MANIGANIESTLQLNIEPFKTNIGLAIGEARKLTQDLNNLELNPKSFNNPFNNLRQSINSIKDQMKTLIPNFDAQLNAITQITSAREREIALGERLSLLSERITLSEQKRVDNASQILSRIQEINGVNSKTLASLNEEVALDSELLGLKGEQNALTTQKMELLLEIENLEKLLVDQYNIESENISKTISLLEEKYAVLNRITATEKEAAVGSKGSRVNELDKPSNILRRSGSMFATMFLFNEAMDVYQKTLDKVNSSNQMEYFGKRLNMTGEQMTKFRGEVDQLQKTYKKIDMTSVAATAEEATIKYGLQTSGLKKLTETYAVVGSAFKKEGRTQEDAILAVNDAMDGEFRRLRELGIYAEDLQKHGWSGDKSDKEGIMKALDEIMQERGFKQTAQDITSVGDALEVIKLQLADYIKQMYEAVSPVILSGLKDFIWGMEKLAEIGGKAYNELKKLWDMIPNGYGIKNGTIKVLGLAMVLGVLVGVTYKIVGAARSAIKGIKGIGSAAEETMDKISTKTKTTTGTTAPTDNRSFKTRFNDNFKKAGSDLGTMARIFVDVAVGVAMAGALIAEGMLIFAGIGALRDQLGDNVDKGIQTINELGKYLLMIMIPVGILVGVLVLFKPLAQLVKSGFSAAAEAIIEVFALIYEGMVGIFGAFVIMQLGMTVLGIIDQYLGQYMDKAPDTIGRIGKFIQSIVDAIGDVLQSVISNAVSVINSVITGALSIANNMTILANALWQTTSAINKLYDNLDGYTWLDGFDWSGKLGGLESAITEINDFAGRVNGKNSSGSTNGVSVTIVNSVLSLASAINQVVTALNAGVGRLRSAGSNLANAVGVGIRSKLGTIRSAGTSLGNAAKSGFTTGIQGMASAMAAEAERAISALTSRTPRMYQAGYNFGNASVQGDRRGHGYGSPGIIARNMKQEIVYTLDNIYGAVNDIYRAGNVLGSSMVKGYGNATLKTNISGLTKSTIDTNRSNILTVNGNTDSQSQSGDTVVINISMPNSTFYGDGDMESRLQTIARNIFVDMNSPNANTGI